MKGRAPNSPATGSQISVRQKLQPNSARDRRDSQVNWTPMATTAVTTSAPTSPLPTRKSRSPPLLDLDRAKRLQFHVDDVPGQRRVTEIRRVLLPVAQRPLHEIDHRLRHRLIRW